jgi:aminoglycoside phosphotransferase family enzyme/predicted kinase
MSDLSAAVVEALPPRIRGLLEPRAYPHPVAEVTLVETHISWVLLTGTYAYKLKKPLDLGFLDFSSLAKRLAACREELRLNRRLAGDLYEAVVAVTGSPQAPRMGGEGPVLEYAVRMKQFPAGTELDRVLARGELQAPVLDALARRIAAFHAGLPRVEPDRPWGMPEAVMQPVEENFRQIRPLLREARDLQALQRVEHWSRRAGERLAERFAARREGGFVRECHGDLHLGNMALVEGEVLVFDCIEFNPALRWIDTVSEAAFLVMDLDDRGHPELDARWLDTYLEYSGDYAGLRLLRFYKVYRAMVRAKVTAIRLGQEDVTADEAEAALTHYRSYVSLAQRYTRTAKPLLVIAHGPSASGKTTLGARLIEALGVVRIRSDVERKRLFGLAPLADSRSALGDGIYTREASERTYARLEQLAGEVLAAGLPVLVEATFLLRKGRDALRRLADSLGAAFAILDFRAPEEVLRARIRARGAGDASEADLEVLEEQLRSRQPLGDDELDRVIAVDTEARPDMEAVAEQLRRLMG